MGKDPQDHIKTDRSLLLQTFRDLILKTDKIEPGLTSQKISKFELFKVKKLKLFYL
jgi:hypothetical protein